MKSDHFDNNDCFVNLTYKCNNNCISCIMENHYQDDSNLTFENIKIKIDNILAKSNHIEFNGGEPTLRKDLFKILNYCIRKNRHIEIGLITNGRLFSYLKNINIVRQYNKNVKIITTLYGYDSKSHDGITRTPGSFSQQVNGIINLIENKFNVEIRIVISKLNYEYLEQIAKFITWKFDTAQIIYINFIYFKPSGQAFYNIKTTNIEVNKVIPQLVASVKILFNNRYKIKISHFPLCMIPKTLWIYAANISSEVNEIIFFDNCSSCIQKLNCCGIWKNHRDLMRTNCIKVIK